MRRGGVMALLTPRSRHERAIGQMHSALETAARLRADHSRASTKFAPPSSTLTSSARQPPRPALVLPVLVLPDDRSLRLPPVLRVGRRHRRVPQEPEAPATSTFYIDRSDYSNDYSNEPESRFSAIGVAAAAALATPRAVDDRSVDFEEPLLNLVIRALDDALRHMRGRSQLGLFAGAAGPSYVCGASGNATTRRSTPTCAYSPSRRLARSSRGARGGVPLHHHDRKHGVLRCGEPVDS